MCKILSIKCVSAGEQGTITVVIDFTRTQL